MLPMNRLHMIAIFLLVLSHASADAQELAAVTQPSEAPIDGSGQMSPIPVVETLHSSLLNLMKNAEELGYQGRFELIVPVIERTFDLDFMSAKCVGRHWKKLSPEEQKVWRSKFSRLVASNYAGNFDRYEGEMFETLGEEPGQRETQMVLTKLRVPKDDDVIFNYRLRETNAGWRIIDIYLKGTVSELALRRSDFASMLKNEGFAELTAAVDKKIADIRQKGGG